MTAIHSLIPYHIIPIVFIGTMPTKSPRHFTAREAYWFTEEVDRPRTKKELLWLRVLDQVTRDAEELDSNDVYKRRDAVEAIA